MTPALALQSIPSDYNIFGSDERNIEARLKRLPKRTLVEDERLTCVRVSCFDVATNSFAPSRTYRNNTGVKEWLSETESSSIRFLSVAQEFSDSPLQIHRSVFQHVLADLKVDLAFLEVVAAFGEAPRISESGFDCLYASGLHDRKFTLFYLHRFVERDNEDDDYQIRQIGLYHRHDRDSESHTFILLQPHEDSAFDLRLALACKNAVSATQIISDPYKIHQLLLETYFDNWRWYLKAVADEFEHESDKVFTADVHKPRSRISYDLLQSWRDQADRSRPLTAYFIAEQRIRSALASVPSKATAQVMKRQYDRLSALVTSANVLLQRIDNVSSLLSNTIDIRNQTDSAALNTHLYNLTKDTVDDSASVRIITFMSLFYLPASFVSSFFGMDFFNYASGKLETSREFWIYVSTVVPLTIVTLTLAWLWKRANDQRRQKRKRKLDFDSVLELR